MADIETAEQWWPDCQIPAQSRNIGLVITYIYTYTHVYIYIYILCVYINIRINLSCIAESWFGSEKKNSLTERRRWL